MAKIGMLGDGNEVAKAWWCEVVDEADLLEVGEPGEESEEGR